MNQIDNIIAGLVAKLKDGGLGASYLIGPFPANPDQFDRGNAQIVLLVQYVGSRYSSEVSGGSQMRAANFALHLTIQNTTDANPHYELSKIHSIVQGAHISGSQMTIVRDGLAGFKGASREFVIEISTQFPTVPGAQPAPSPFLEDFSQTEAN